jgi:hypothetical protein
MKQKILYLVMILGMAMLSCQTESIGHAKIIAIDQSFNPVQGATVVFSKPPGIIVATGITDANGIFIYDHTVPETEILNVEVTSSDSLRVGLGIVRAEPDTTRELTLLLYLQ